MITWWKVPLMAIGWILGEYLFKRLVTTPIPNVVDVLAFSVFVALMGRDRE